MKLRILTIDCFQYESYHVIAVKSVYGLQLLFLHIDNRRELLNKDNSWICVVEHVC